MRFCIKCGAQIAPGYKFCTVCGAPVFQAPPQPQQQDPVQFNGYQQQPPAHTYPVFRQTPPPEINIPPQQTPQQPIYNQTGLQVPPQQIPPTHPMQSEQPPQPEQHQPVVAQDSTPKPLNTVSDSLNDKVNNLVRECLRTNGYLLKEQAFEPDGLEFRRNNRSFIYNLTQGDYGVPKHFTIATLIATFEEKALTDMINLISTINYQDFAPKMYYQSEAISRKKDIYYIVAQYSFPKHLITEENVTSLIEEITDELTLQVKTFLDTAKYNGITKFDILD